MTNSLFQGHERAKVFNLVSFQAGIDPDATLHHPGSKAASIGIKCGLAVAELATHDSLNLFGNITGQKYNLVPYSDYTNYAPVNTGYKLVDKTRWQPLINPVKNSLGQFAEQVGPIFRFASCFRTLS